MTSRRKLREMAFSLMFQVEVGNHDPEQLMETTFQEEEIPVSDKKFIRVMLRGVHREQNGLDSIIGEYAKGWRVSRLARIDLTILRVSIYEMLYGLSGMEADVPVVINEAVLLAKKYSGPESGRFINGILGSIAKDMQDLEKRVGKIAGKANVRKG